MKVNIYETVQVSDDDRVAIARSIDGDGAKKRPATRDEIKAYVWEHGSGWRSVLLGSDHEDVAGTPENDPTTYEDDGIDLEDLI